MDSKLYNEKTTLTDLAHNNKEYESLIEQYKKKIAVTSLFLEKKEFIDQEIVRIKSLFIIPFEFSIGGDFKKGYGINYTEYKKQAYDSLSMGQNLSISHIINNAKNQHLQEKPQNFPFNENEFSKSIFKNLSDGVALLKYERFLKVELNRIKPWYKRVTFQISAAITFIALMVGLFSDGFNLLDRLSKKSIDSQEGKNSVQFDSVGKNNEKQFNKEDKDSLATTKIDIPKVTVPTNEKKQDKSEINNRIPVDSTRTKDQDLSKAIPASNRNLEKEKIVTNSDNVTRTSKNPNCKGDNTGDFCFQNTTELELRITIYAKNDSYTNTIQPNLDLCFFDVMAGAVKFEITNDELPGTVHPYNTPGSPVVKKPRHYSIDGSIYLDQCKKNIYTIK